MLVECYSSKLEAVYISLIDIKIIWHSIYILHLMLLVFHLYGCMILKMKGQLTYWDIVLWVFTF